jgi:hypothetical protein
LITRPGLHARIDRVEIRGQTMLLSDLSSREGGRVSRLTSRFFDHPLDDKGVSRRPFSAHAVTADQLLPSGLRKSPLHHHIIADGILKPGRPHADLMPGAMKSTAVPCHGRSTHCRVRPTLFDGHFLFFTLGRGPTEVFHRARGPSIDTAPAGLRKSKRGDVPNPLCSGPVGPVLRRVGPPKRGA